MGDFVTYTRWGLEHITDPGGFDHMLFLVTLCAVYPPKAWKQLLLLATAFTVGHSVTLALTASGYRFISAETVEVLIPITIFLTAVYNLLTYRANPKVRPVNYALAAGFGLIHGMGFAGFFTHLLEGIRDDIVLPLLWFNVGLEVGQLVIVGAFVGLSWLVLRFGVPAKGWSLGVSVLGALLSVYLLVNVLSGG